MSEPGQVFVLSGPPGAGKSSVGARIKKDLPDLAYSVSFTTRSPRSGEVNGVDYHFITRDEFEQKIAAGEMVEHEEIFGNLYGTSAEVVKATVKQGRDLFLDTDVNGAAALKKMFPQGVFIFLAPPSRAELERRLRGRGTEDEANISQRLARVEYEMKAAVNATHLVINDDLDQAVSQIKGIIAADRLRTARRLADLRREWGF